MDYQRILFKILQFRRYVFGGLGVCLLVMAAALAMCLWPESAPPKAPEVRQNAAEKTMFIASEGFNRLNIETRQQYMEKVLRDRSLHVGMSSARKELNEDQKKLLRKNLRPVLHKMVETRVDRYFTLPQEKREEYLDELIDQATALNLLKNRRTTSEDMPSLQYVRSGEGEHRRRSPHDKKSFGRLLARTTPQQRSKMIRFGLAAMKRLKERELLPKK